MKNLVIITAVVLVSGCATYEMGEYEPIPAANYTPDESWPNDLRICQEKYALWKAGKGAYRVAFNDCMKRLGHQIDEKASKEKYRDAES